MITERCKTEGALKARRQEVAFSTYLADDLAADLLTTCQTAAVRQVGRCDDADDAAVIAALYLAPRVVGADLTADDLRAMSWDAVRTVVRRDADTNGDGGALAVGDAADLADLADDAPALFLTSGATPDPAAPYRTRPADLRHLAADLAAREWGADLTAAVLAAIDDPWQGTPPERQNGAAPVVTTAVRLLTGSTAADPTKTRLGRQVAPHVRAVLADLPAAYLAAVDHLASGAVDHREQDHRTLTTADLAAHLRTLPERARRATWPTATADLAADLAATPAHLAATPAAPSRSSAVVTTGRPAPWAAVVVTVGAAVVATYLPGTDATAWLRVTADDYRPTTADLAADGFAARQESPGAVRKPSARRKGGSGSTGPTVPARLSR